MTAIKKIYQKALPFFGASFSLIPSESISNRFSKLLNSPKEVTINAKLGKKASTQKELERKENPALENYKKSLNQTKVYLVVNKNSSQLCLLEHNQDSYNHPLMTRARLVYGLLYLSFDKKYDNNILYLSDPKGPFGENSRPPAPTYGVHYMAFEPFVDYRGTEFKTWREGRVDDLKRLKITSSIVRRRYAILETIFEYPKEKKAYKPICPVFFNLKDAAEFLKDGAQKYGIFEMPKKKQYDPYYKTEKTDIARGEVFEKTKIISLGLGDFMDYYSSHPNEKNKLDFLFMPDFEKGKFKTKTIGPSREKIKANFDYMFGPKEDKSKPPLKPWQRPALIERVAYSKGFKDYEKEFQKYKEMN